MTHPIQSMTLQSVLMETSEKPPTAAFDRNPAAFGAIYRAYLDPVYRYLLVRVGNTADAEDLTSQVFLAALEGLPRYQEQGYFAAWLFSIARRKAADYFRRHPADAPLDPENDPPAPGVDLLTHIIHQEDLQNLVKQIAEVPEEERELLRFRFAARLSFDEMAVVLNRKTSAVKMSLYRLLERLENQLEADRD
jgi:RNA polymerase sigma-70 factor (ECF subfamily)